MSQWKTKKGGRDSNVRNTEDDINNPLARGVGELKLAEVILPQPEPMFMQHLVTVEFLKGGKSTGVCWPGPHVSLSKAGIPAGSAQAIHGLWEAPMPGQMVLVGFESGNYNAPMVVQKYPYNPSKRPDMKAAYYLPLTTMGHGSFDVVLGHFTGSFVALRGGPMGLPGQIEVNAMTYLSLGGITGVDICTDGLFETYSSTITMEDISGNMIKTTPTGVEITDRTGNTIITSPTSVTIEAKGNLILKTPAGSAAWCPNSLQTCLYTGAPHGGISGGISDLLGG